MAAPSNNTFISLMAEFRRLDATRTLVVGGDTALFKYDVANKALVQISTAGPYSPTRPRPWKAVAYNDKFYMTNQNDVIQVYDGTTCVPIANAPKGWSINILNNHLCVFGVDRNPWTFQWAAEGGSDFVATATNDAGQFDVIDNDDVAMNLLPLNIDLIGYKDHSIHAFTYIGGQAVMGHRRMVSDVGLMAPDAIAAFTDRHIFLGNPPGVYEYTGGNSVDSSIGRPVEDKIFGEMTFARKDLCKCLVIDQTKEILFFYANQTALKAANRVVIYNMRDKTWYGPFDIVGSEVDATCQFSIDFGNVIDSFTSTFPDNVNTIIDLYGVVAGIAGEPLFATTNGDIMVIGGLNSANGVFINRTGTTGDVFLGGGGTDGFGAGINLPLGSVFQVNKVDVELLNVSNLAVNYYIGSRMTLADSFRWKGPYPIVGAPGRKINIPLRSYPGRWFASKFELLNNAPMNLAGFQYYYSFSGER
jgi:hypothetical protein